MILNRRQAARSCVSRRARSGRPAQCAGPAETSRQHVRRHNEDPRQPTRSLNQHDLASCFVSGTASIWSPARRRAARAIQSDPAPRGISHAVGIPRLAAPSIGTMVASGIARTVDRTRPPRPRLSRIRPASTSMDDRRNPAARARSRFAANRAFRPHLALSLGVAVHCLDPRSGRADQHGAGGWAPCRI